MPEWSSGMTRNCVGFTCAGSSHAVQVLSRLSILLNNSLSVLLDDNKFLLQVAGKRVEILHVYFNAHYHFSCKSICRSGHRA